MSEADDAGYSGENAVQQAAYFAGHNGNSRGRGDAYVALLGAGPRQCARLKRINGKTRGMKVCVASRLSQGLLRCLLRWAATSE
jgi:hypothetical protein